MRRGLALLVMLAASCSGGTGDAVPAAAAKGPAAEGAAATAGLTVVELFQSQGCSSCPPANANVNALVERPGILALSFAVTYWDYLGWKDKFAQPAFTARQRAYARSSRSDGVYTPQVVINGRRALVGANRASLGRAITAEGPLRGGPAIARDGNAVLVGAQAGAPAATVLVVTYDPRERRVPIRAGENNGKTLPHRNIVTDLREAGRWSGKAQRFALPAPADPGLRTAVLLQRGDGGPIVAARRL
ncbi:MAG: DUF1223 domain-containing protein [Novosphingobium sp.]